MLELAEQKTPSTPPVAPE